MMRLFIVAGFLFFLSRETVSPLLYRPCVRVEIKEFDFFNEAVESIKQFEGWHGEKHYPYIGYGHKLRPDDQINLPISETIADSILRADLLLQTSLFRHFGKDSLILGVLAYNVGAYTLLGYGKRPKSNLIRKLEAGDRDIYEEYISYRKWNGKVVPSIERRRRHEFELLFDKTKTVITYGKQ